MSLTWWRNRHNVCAALLVVAAAYLTFKSLDNTYFWDDEAEVAIFARNLVKRGELTAWDGRNLFAFRNGTTLDDQLHSLQPPLMFYATAAALFVLGDSTWAGRLPHALAGLIALLVFYRVLRRQYGDTPEVALYGLAVLGGSVQYLLAVRQCRYYGLCALGAVCTYSFYRRLQATNQWRDALGLSASAAFLFFAHYLAAVVFLVCLGILHLAIEARAWGWARHKKVFAAALLFVALTIPYAIIHEIWERRDLPRQVVPWYEARFWLTWMFFRDVNQTNVMPGVVFAALTVLAVKTARLRQRLNYMLGLVVLIVLATAWVAPQNYQPTNPLQVADTRYLICVIPFAAAAMALGLGWLHRRQRWAAISITAALLTSTALAVPKNLAYQLLLPAYLREIHNPYPTADEKAVEAIRRHAATDDLVLAIPDYEQLPLLFYDGDKVRTCCVLGNSSPLMNTAVPRFAAHTLIQDNFPDWIVLFGDAPEAPAVLNYMQRVHQERGQTRQYRYALVERLGVYHNNTQRSEVTNHHFGPVTDYDPKTQDVYVLHRERVQ